MVHVSILSASPAVRLGLKALLESDFSIEVSDEAVDPIDSRGTSVDVLIYAPVYGVEHGLESIRDQLSGGEALLVLTEDIEAAQILSELPLRGWGMLSSSASGEELGAAVMAVNEGLIVLDAVVAKKLVQYDPGQTGEVLETGLEPLTERETEVLQLIVHGLSNKQIAAQLNVSPHTVKFHISSIYGKLGAANRTEAARIGLRKGLVIL